MKIVAARALRADIRCRAACKAVRLACGAVCSEPGTGSAMRIECRGAKIP